jgi:hypothetical protein
MSRFESEWCFLRQLPAPSLLLFDTRNKAAHPYPHNRGAWNERVLKIRANMLSIPSTRARPQHTVLNYKQCLQEVLVLKQMPMKMNKNLTIMGKG